MILNNYGHRKEKRAAGQQVCRHLENPVGKNNEVREKRIRKILEMPDREEKFHP